MRVNPIPSHLKNKKLTAKSQAKVDSFFRENGDSNGRVPFSESQLLEGTGPFEALDKLAEGLEFEE